MFRGSLARVVLLVAALAAAVFATPVELTDSDFSDKVTGKPLAIDPCRHNEVSCSCVAAEMIGFKLKLALHLPMPPFVNVSGDVAGWPVTTWRAVLARPCADGEYADGNTWFVKFFAP